VKRALASVAGLVGIAALGRWLAKRRHPVAAVPEPADAAPTAEVAADPAEELRRKLADARYSETPPAAASAAEPESLDERRARVHAKAREAIDAMGEDATTGDEAGL
jgi:hypothetical protein